MSTPFRVLHEQGCFAIPNPWDVGSAKLFASLGFQALASTSAGLAFAKGRPDTPTSLSLDEVLENLRELVEATPLPVQADFQAGYSHTAEGVGRNVLRCAETGVAGLSIEDATGDDNEPLFPVGVAVERIMAAKEAIEASGRDVVLTARAECFLVGHPNPLSESIARLQAYSEAGADCLYAPGLRTAEQIQDVVEAVAPKPVNVLAADPSWMTTTSLGELGVRRVSVGSALARVGWAAIRAAAAEIARDGTFGGLASATPFSELDDVFSAR